ncbi:MAG: hypothetical protein EOQ44_25485 [Mesorhizobium sp.]|uniref:hypothetical protein n=1 Tax=Mesorhizobium sp. TaxID=1871066 RepID=UPI000FEA2387|nr:hypothetical protein [Mesorhizobium sp.]RWB40493.1 MAG: hypothetical protein EOQ44_25485 [Mesorhizobium sp.]
MWINLDPNELEIIRIGLAEISPASNWYESAQQVLKKLDEWETTSRSADSKAYRDAADELYGREGELEFDDSSDGTNCVSAGADPGAYVMGWRWVTSDQAGLTFTCECCDKVKATDELDPEAGDKICKDCTKEE